MEIDYETMEQLAGLDGLGSIYVIKFKPCHYGA